MARIGGGFACILPLTMPIRIWVPLIWQSPPSGDRRSSESMA